MACEIATELCGSVYDLEGDQFRLLHRASEGHTLEQNHPDVKIQTCWDSERLDLRRIGIMPNPSRLCTALAKRPETTKWADGRASFRVSPLSIGPVGIDLERERGGDVTTTASQVN